MAEHIKDVDMVEQHNKDLTSYSIYVARKRVIPDYRDGLKSVHRRIIYAMYRDLHAYNNKQIKTATVVGDVIGKYHPHGDASVADAMQPMTNWFECKIPYLSGFGGWGDMLGGRMAATRYTETKLSDYTMDCIISELKETDNSIDWEPNYSSTLLEPEFFPAAVPNLLINGAFGIGSGLAVSIPRHNFAEVIDATINLMHDPNYDVILVPDNCMDTDIIATDFAKICRTGKGKYKVRARVTIEEYKGKPALKITSVPDLTFFDKIKAGIEKLITNNKLPQVADLIDLSEDDKDDITQMKVYLVLKKGSDPNYVRDILFVTTELEKGFGVNFEILKDNVPMIVSYKQYLQLFIEFRRMTKYRMYCNKMNDVKTQYHKMELYIRALESGEIDNIISMIRKQKGTDDHEYIEYLIKKLGVTDAQAKFLLDTDIRKLSKGYLETYKKKRDELTQISNVYFNMINNPDMILKEIEDELLLYKKKYARPRMSKIISEADSKNIPQGEFLVIITKNNFIKKMEVTDNIGSLGGDEAKCIFKADNTDNVLIFGSLGKVFKLPINSIPFAPKGNPGIDIRKFIKYLTSDICSVVTESNLKIFAENPHNFIYVLTRNGFIKRMDCADFITTPPSGLIFSKLEEGDMITDVLFMPDNMHLVVYSRNKVLRLEGMEAPYLRRSTKGNYVMNTQFPMDGMDCIYPGATCLIVVTNHGYVNKIPVEALPLSKRMKVGNSVIKLGKNDVIVKIAVCKETDSINLYNNNITTISVAEIPAGSSIGTGKKYVSNIFKAEVIH